ncbi:hypothetical protein [Nocardia veterana]|uniref:hypothetical protein n=1 Tax=Nocardia veterana TaxID=132249 RepID=UPI001FE23E2D|nr:hypothetical protein [Nocardia veterana]
MSPRQIHTAEEASQYLAEALGTSRKYRMFPFELGWVIYPILSEQEIDRGGHIGLSKMVLDARTGVITELPSLPVDTVAQMYTAAMRDGARMPGGQIYPPRTRVHMTLIRDDPTTVEYLIRPESTTDLRQSTDYLLVIDKRTRTHQPPGTMNTLAAAWIDHRQRIEGVWPRRGTTQY